jgi:hypothetical protein
MFFDLFNDGASNDWTNEWRTAKNVRGGVHVLFVRYYLNIFVEILRKTIKILGQ